MVSRYTDPRSQLPRSCRIAVLGQRPEEVMRIARFVGPFDIEVLDGGCGQHSNMVKQAWRVARRTDYVLWNKGGCRYLGPDFNKTFVVIEITGVSCVRNLLPN